MNFDVNGISNHIGNSIKVKKEMLNDKAFLSGLLTLCRLCVAAYKSGNKIILAGNGGSAADAQHIAAELVSRFRFDRPGLPSLSLSTDTSVLTAISNDYGYERVFSRQLQSNGYSGDIFIGITTSGRSKNITEAFKVCSELGIHSVALTSIGGAFLEDLVDLCLCVPSNVTAYIQEAHIMIGHIICGLVESALFDEKL